MSAARDRKYCFPMALEMSPLATVACVCAGACLNQSKLSPNGNFPGDTSFGNGRAIRDMGGCDVDLEGGEYLISK